jgi:hypothetical protein
MKEVLISDSYDSKIIGRLLSVHLQLISTSAYFMEIIVSTFAQHVGEEGGISIIMEEITPTPI